MADDGLGLYREVGAFDSAVGPVSVANDPSNDTDDDNTFSGPGDINRSEDDDASEPWEPTSAGESGATNARSRAWNALAADTETDVPEYGRAFAQAGAGGSVGDDDMVNHVYGES
jgi:hypothetical protein